MSREPPHRSAPLLTLAEALRQQGVATRFAGGCELASTSRWFPLIWGSEALVLVHYDECSMHLQRQLHLARITGSLVVRWWVGTDVWNCLQSERVAASARALDAAVHMNLAVAPHLVRELATVGLEARYAPSICELPERNTPEGATLPKTVLAYLPTTRRHFYGLDALEAAILGNPDLEFIIVADDDHTLAHYPNVQSLGWLDDLDALWPRVGLVLRMTQHDGLPRMLLEAMARARHVIFSWPLDGCWHARDTEQMQHLLERFKVTTAPNTEGREAARRIASNAPSRFLSTLEQTRIRVRSRDILSAVPDFLRCQFEASRAAETSAGVDG